MEGYGKIFKHENLEKWFYPHTKTIILSIIFTLILNMFYSSFQIDSWVINQLLHKPKRILILPKGWTDSFVIH